MARLVWDTPGLRRFHNGVDRGVLYFPGEDDSVVAIPWNGLISVEESFDDESKPYYLDGVKYMDAEVPGDYLGKVKAFTYPEELERATGLGYFGQGLLMDDQPPTVFGLSYRTGLGDDTVGMDRGYQIHVLFSVFAFPDPKVYSTRGAQAEALEFGWNLSGKPQIAEGFRPTAHLIIDSTEIDKELLDILEDTLYGSDEDEAGLPPLQQFVDIITTFASIVITDNGDGTWTATGRDRFFTMLDPTTFMITEVDATYVDPETYVVSTTTVGDLPEYATISVVDNGDGTWTAEVLDQYFSMIGDETFMITDVDAYYIDEDTYVTSSTA